MYAIANNIYNCTKQFYKTPLIEFLQYIHYLPQILHLESGL